MASLAPHSTTFEPRAAPAKTAWRAQLRIAHPKTVAAHPIRVRYGVWPSARSLEAKADGGWILTEVHGLVTLGTLGGHGRCARSVRALHPRSSLRRRPRLPRPPPDIDWLRDLGGASGARPLDASSWARCRRGAPARVGRAGPSAPYPGVRWHPQGSPEDSMATLAGERTWDPQL